MGVVYCRCRMWQHLSLQRAWYIMSIILIRSVISSHILAFAILMQSCVRNFCIAPSSGKIPNFLVYYRMIHRAISIEDAYISASIGKLGNWFPGTVEMSLFSWFSSPCMYEALLRCAIGSAFCQFAYILYLILLSIVGILYFPRIAWLLSIVGRFSVRWIIRPGT